MKVGKGRDGLIRDKQHFAVSRHGFKLPLQNDGVRLSPKLGKKKKSKSKGKARTGISVLMSHL